MTRNTCARQQSILIRYIFLHLLLFAPLCANAVSISAPFQIKEGGSFTLSWSGATDYSVLYEKKNGIWVQDAMFSKSGSKLYSGRSRGVYEFKVKDCDVVGSQSGVSHNCSFGPVKKVRVVWGKLTSPNTTCLLPRPTVSDRCITPVTRNTRGAAIVCIWLSDGRVWSCGGGDQRTEDWIYTTLVGTTFILKAHDDYPGYNGDTINDGVLLDTLTVKALEKPQKPGAIQASDNVSYNGFKFYWGPSPTSNVTYLYRHVGVFSGSGYRPGRELEVRTSFFGQVHSVDVSACYKDNLSICSDAVRGSFTPQSKVTLPPPGSLSVITPPSNNSISASWSSVPGAAFYKVQFVKPNGGHYTFAKVYETAKSYSATLNGRFSVRVWGCEGHDKCSTEFISKSIDFVVKPGVPSVSSSGDSETKRITVSWERLASMDSYRVYSPHSGWQVVGGSSFSELVPSYGTHTYKVRVYSSYGSATKYAESSASVSLSEPALDIPVMPPYLTVLPDSALNRFETSWGTSSGSTRYELYVNNARKYNGSSRSYSHSVGSVLGGFTFKVRACNSAGCSSYTSKKVSQSPSVSYEYDALGRLKTVTKGDDETSYQYDDAGNRTSVSVD
ncbi:phage tail protein [Gilvimarinus agarilyticus]|uniref:RHS repeat domain-containing protein n=1 Tax=Gilvimarinus agarilyticus TaxID=679259 RepID=UPI0012F9BD23|nr:RHS repeat domain-containing protein [Gilvimarinus agarilyticus]